MADMQVSCENWPMLLTHYSDDSSDQRGLSYSALLKRLIYFQHVYSGKMMLASCSVFDDKLLVHCISSVMP